MTPFWEYDLTMYNLKPCHISGCWYPRSMRPLSFYLYCSHHISCLPQVLGNDHHGPTCHMHLRPAQTLSYGKLGRFSYLSSSPFRGVISWVASAGQGIRYTARYFGHFHLELSVLDRTYRPLLASGGKYMFKPRWDIGTTGCP